MRGFAALGRCFVAMLLLCPPPSVYVGPIAVTLTDVSTYTILLPNGADSPGRPVWKIMCVSDPELKVVVVSFSSGSVNHT